LRVSFANTAIATDDMAALLIVAHTRARERRARIRAAAPPIYFWRIRFALLDGGGGRGVEPARNTSGHG
jgi:hypothetical protein